MLIGSKVTRKSIERALYKRLGDVLESNDHYPQKIGKTEVQFNTALAALRTANKMILALEGVSSGYNKKIDYNNRIIIYRSTSDDGDYGQYVEWIETNAKVAPSDPDVFTKYRADSPVTDLEYEFRYVTEDVDADREMERMLTIAFRKRTYLPSLNDNNTSGQKFFMMFRNEINLSADGVIERAYRFVIKDIVLVVPDAIRENIPPANIVFDIKTDESQIADPFPDPAP